MDKGTSETLLIQSLKPYLNLNSHGLYFIYFNELQFLFFRPYKDSLCGIIICALRVYVFIFSSLLFSSL